MLKYLMLPVQASTHAASLDEMTALVHWLMLVLFVGWGAFFVFVLVRFRKKANPRADYAGAKGKFAKSTEVAVAIIEVVLLVGYAIPAWAVRVKTLPSESEAVVVRVVAEQFAWNIHYPGPDGMFGRTDVKLVNADNPLGLDRSDPNAKDDITTINQLNLPIESPRARASVEQGRHPQLRGVRDAREAGRHSRHEHPGLVHPESRGRVRDRLLATLRPGSLPDARLRDDPERGGLPEMVGRSGERTEAGGGDAGGSYAGSGDADAAVGM